MHPLTVTSPRNNLTAHRDAAYRDLLTKLSSRRRLHHVSFAVISSDGEQYWSGSCAPTGTGAVEVRPETPFFIASITKRFIITLVLQAHERGELGLDSPIATYLPESVTAGLHIHKGADLTSRITVRHLASHTSGLAEYFEHRQNGQTLFKELRMGKDKAWEFADVVQMVREQQRSYFEPQDLADHHQAARYSDTGFQLLIRILETVSSQPFPDLLTERILVPLSLTHTWHPQRAAPAGEPPPLPLYANQRRVHVPNLIRSSNDLFSTLDDLLTFERALVAGALFRSPATAGLLTERKNRLRNAPSLRYGLGTMLFTVNRLMLPRHGPTPLVGHSGSTGTWLFTAPTLGVHLVGTVNQTQAQALPFHVMAKLLKIWVS